MCGIVFTISDDTYCDNLDDWFADALLASQVRGLHSTGMFQVNEGTSTIFKKDVNASEFLNLEGAKQLLRGVPWRNTSVGHVRHATSGNISAENAHPFRAEREDGSYIIMVHNGSLQGWRNKKESSRFQVDSEWMAHMLAMEGHDAFEYFNGAFALVWYDSNHPDSLFMARNKERPLHYIITNGGKTIIGCSELGMLGWLSHKHDLELDEKSQFNSPYYLEEGKIYKFNMKNIGEFSIVDYPKYDPSTSLPPAATLPVAMTPKYSGLYNDDPYYDDMNDAIWGSYGSYSMANYLEDEQTDVLEGVKSALRKARTSLAQPVATSPRLLTVVGIDDPPVEAYDEEPDHIDRGAVHLTTINTSSATKNEIARAKKTGVFGMVVRFCGIIFDPSTSSLLGTFSLFENGTWVEQDAEMRFISQQIAARFDEQAHGVVGYAGVCGISEQAGDDTVVLLAPLDPEQTAFVGDYTEAMTTPTMAKAL